MLQSRGRAFWEEGTAHGKALKLAVFTGQHPAYTAVNLRSCPVLELGSSQSPGGAWRKQEEFWLMIKETPGGGGGGGCRS